MENEADKRNYDKGTRKRCCEKAASATTAGQEHNGNASTEKSVPLDEGLSVIIQQKQEL